MSLYTRLLNQGGTPIDYHAFCGAMNENAADQITITELAEAFNLSASEQTSAEQIINLFGGDPPAMTLQEIFYVLSLGKSGVMYDTESSLMARLGVTE